MLDLQGDELGAPERTHVTDEDERRVAATPQRRGVTRIENSIQHGAAVITLLAGNAPAPIEAHQAENIPQSDW